MTHFLFVLTTRLEKLHQFHRIILILTPLICHIDQCYVRWHVVIQQAIQIRCILHKSAWIYLNELSPVRLTSISAPFLGIYYRVCLSVYHIILTCETIYAWPMTRLSRWSHYRHSVSLAQRHACLPCAEGCRYLQVDIEVIVLKDGRQLFLFVVAILDYIVVM